MDEPGFFSIGKSEVLLRVKAKPHARENAVLGVRAGELMVAVRSPAEKGKATAEVITVIANALGLPPSSVVLKSGAASPHKTFILPRHSESALRKLGYIR